MISNIPIYRAKHKNIDNYVIGYEYYNHIEDEYYITHYATGNNYKIDRSTRSIHFEGMIDSQGNKVFASLSEDGKGGDVLYYKSKIDLVTKTTLYFENYRLITHSKGENTFRDKESLSKFEIIGIKE